MRELSLFSGAGGGLLASLMLGFRHVGYVESNEYCQSVIRQRIDDGILPEAPMFGDIRAFLDQGYARSYQGMVDIITAGFPCQPFAICGKRKGADDERNMWPQTVECIRQVRPQFAFLENVAGLLADAYIRSIFADLAEVGLNAEWVRMGGATPVPSQTAKEFGYSLLRPTAQASMIFNFKQITSLIRPKGRAPGNIQEQLAERFRRMITPECVEIVMQWPEGWSDCEPLGTDKIRAWQSRHFKHWPQELTGATSHETTEQN